MTQNERSRATLATIRNHLIVRAELRTAVDHAIDLRAEEQRAVEEHGVVSAQRRAVRDELAQAQVVAAFWSHLTTHRLCHAWCYSLQIDVPRLVDARRDHGRSASRADCGGPRRGIQPRARRARERYVCAAGY